MPKRKGRRRRRREPDIERDDWCRFIERGVFRGTWPVEAATALPDGDAVVRVLDRMQFEQDHGLRPGGRWVRRPDRKRGDRKPLAIHPCTFVDSTREAFMEAAEMTPPRMVVTMRLPPAVVQRAERLLIRSRGRFRSIGQVVEVALNEYLELMEEDLEAQRKRARKKRDATHEEAE